MELTLSRKIITQIFACIVSIIVLIMIGYAAYSNGLLDRWLAKDMQASTVVTTEEPAMQALVAFYTPDITGEQVVWENNVCAGMSAEGCDLFRNMYAPALWKTARSDPPHATVFFLSIAETLQDGSQIWMVNLTTAETSEPIYIHVVQSETGKWLLHRVLFAQEAAKYKRSSSVDENR